MGTAGQNNVLTMIPARDQQEFDLLPKRDRAFIKDWLAWTDTNLEYLRHTAPIATLDAPGVGHVDGTCAIDPGSDDGFLFLFNPNHMAMNASLAVDESMGISNTSATSHWTVTQLYPEAGKGKVVGVWEHGQGLQVEVGGSDALVLQLDKKTEKIEETESAGVAVQLIGAKGAAGVGADQTLHLTEVEGVYGSTEKLTVAVASSEASLPHAAVAAVQVNGVACTGDARAQATTRLSEVEVEVDFVGDSPVYHAMPISPTAVATPDFKGGWFNVTFVIPAAIKSQLQQRQEDYPIKWEDDDYHAAWLVPTRLLMFPFLSPASDSMEIEMWIDGKNVTLTKAYNR